MSKKPRKVDVGGMYPNIYLSFCLSPENYIGHQEMPEYFPSEQEIADTIHKGYKVWSLTKWGFYLIRNNIIPIPVEYRQEIDDLKSIKEYKQADFSNINKLRGIYYFKQNPDAILCKAFEEPMKWKAELKKKLANTSEDDPLKSVVKEEYDASKRFNNTGFGGSGNPFSRLFKLEVFNADTYLGRSFMLYMKQRAEKMGYDIIFIDTDSFVILAEDNITDLLNQWSIDWAMEVYGNKKMKLQFEDEGYYTALYVGGNCRYMGKRIQPNGEETLEIKGLQVKRKSSTNFEKIEQKAFLNYLLEGHDIVEIKKYIHKWIKRMYSADLLDLAKPCKFSKPREEYGKNEEFFTAYDNTQKLKPEFTKNIEDQFHYIYVETDNLLAFDKNDINWLKEYKIDYQKIMEKQIFNLLVPTFAGLNMGSELLDLMEEYNILVGSQHRNTLLEEYQNFEELRKYYSAREVKKRRKEKLDTN